MGGFLCFSRCLFFLIIYDFSFPYTLFRALWLFMHKSISIRLLVIYCYKYIAGMREEDEKDGIDPVQFIAIKTLLRNANSKYFSGSARSPSQLPSPRT